MTRFDHDVILEKRKGQTGAAAALQCNGLRRVRLSTEEALKWLISEKGDRLGGYCTLWDSPSLLSQSPASWSMMTIQEKNSKALVCRISQSPPQMH